MRHKIFITTLITVFLCLGQLSVLRAESNYDIKQMTPAIQAAVQNRKIRYEELQRFKADGLIGETRQGFVKALQDSPQAEQFASQENSDRKTIYQAIVNQNDLGPAGMGKVKAVFAEVQREKARAGDWIEQSSGEWIKKQG